MSDDMRMPFEVLVDKSTLKDTTKDELMRLPNNIQAGLLAMAVAIIDTISNPENKYPRPPDIDVPFRITFIRKQEAKFGIEIDIEGLEVSTDKIYALAIGPLNPITWEPLEG